MTTRTLKLTALTAGFALALGTAAVAEEVNTPTVMSDAQLESVVAGAFTRIFNNIASDTSTFEGNVEVSSSPYLAIDEAEPNVFVEKSSFRIDLEPNPFSALEGETYLVRFRCIGCTS